MTPAALAFCGPAPMPQRAAAPFMAAYSWFEPGVGETWDPLNLARSPEKFERLRYVEVKHGRIAMLACLGQFVTGAGYRFPGELGNGVKFSSVTGDGFEAFKQLSIGDYALILLSVGFLEINVMKETVKGEFPGDLRNGLFKEGWDGFSEADKKRKLNKAADQRKAMLRSLTTEVIRHGKITTTLARCKELRKTTDHMITLAKDGSLHARRQALGYIYDKQLVHSLFDAVPERYGERNGGYTRVLRDGYRLGDNAEVGIIELV